jgi:hypothetical protein
MSLAREGTRRGQAHTYAVIFTSLRKPMGTTRYGAMAEHGWWSFRLPAARLPGIDEHAGVPTGLRPTISYWR